MGAYLSKPVTEKFSSNARLGAISYGASSMQGWRYFQEDAHNCILDYDPEFKSALFAVYDGHGGVEVAQYCQEKLPEYLKAVPSYTSGDMRQALIDSFLGFDASLVQPEGKAALKLLVKEPDGSDGESDSASTDADEAEETSTLCAEADMPLEAVLKQYVGMTPEAAASRIQILRQKGGKKFQSPCVRRQGAAASGDAAAETPETLSSCTPSSVVAAASAAVESALGENENNLNLEREKKAGEDGGQEATAPIENGLTAETKESSPKKAATKPVKVVDKEEEDGDGDYDEEHDEDYKEADEEEEEDEEEDDDEDEEEEGEEEEDDDDEEEEDDDDEDQMFPLMQMNTKPEPGSDSGSTAVVALLRGSRLFVANAGDSRAVLCRGGRAVDLSVDHKPEDADETARIKAAGGTVTKDGRVNGGLNLSRAIGDHLYKLREDLSLSEQMITALPDVTETELESGKDEFLMLACDGIWNSMTSQEVVDFVRQRLPSTDNGTQPLSSICEELFDHCLSPDTTGDGTGCDNMTCIIIRFHPTATVTQTDLPTKDNLDNHVEAVPAPAAGSLKRPLPTNGDSEQLEPDSSSAVCDSSGTPSKRSRP